MARFLALSLLLVSQLARAQAPAQISYQGRLLKIDGSPEAGVVSMDFALCDAATAGNCATARQTLMVALSDGFYSVLLKVTPADDLSGPRFLSIKVGGTELIPRQALASVPFALQGGVATGAVQAFAQATCPTGWVAANGSAIDRATYAALFAAIGTTYGAGDGTTTFNLPELRGEFIRGWDNGRNVDKTRALGTSQSDSFQAHEHGQYAGSNGPGAQSWSNGTNLVIATLGIMQATGYSAPRFADETRPRNVALLYCIKY